MTLEKKKVLFDKECCHELNTFIKFKDPSFFKAIVVPYIKNKVNKNIVDLILLDSEEIAKYRSI